MSELVTTETIVEFFEKSVQQKRVVDSHTWIDGAQKLNALLGGEHDVLFQLQQKVAKMRVELLSGGAKVGYAKMVVDSSDEYREMQTQKAKIGRIEEMIRIAKLQARLKDSEMRGYQ